MHLWHVTEDVDLLVAMCRRRGINPDVMLAYKARSRRIEVLVERLLLCVIFGKPVELQHTPQGQPFVPDSRLHMSITHTCSLVCVAINERCDVGVDVERKGTRVLKVRSRFLNDAEQQFIPAHDAHATLTAWTAKEALYKVIHNEQVTMRDHLSLSPFAPHAEQGALCFSAHYMDREFVVKSMSWQMHVLTLAVEACYDGACETQNDNILPNIIEL